MKGIVALFSERGWSIEYIMSLTWHQLDCLLEGTKELNIIRDKATKKAGDEAKLKQDKKDNKPQVSDAFQMLSLPGFQMSPEAKEKIIKIMKDKANKNKEKSNG